MAQAEEIAWSGLELGQARIDQLVVAASKYIDSQFGAQALLVGVMNGALRWTHDIARRLPEYEVTSVRASRFAQLSEAGEFELHIAQRDLQNSMKARQIVLLDTIIGTGETLREIAHFLAKLGLHKVSSVCLLGKHTAEEYQSKSLPVSWVGHKQQTDQWLVGYGLDLNGRYRGMDDIRIVPTDLQS